MIAFISSCQLLGKSILIWIKCPVFFINISLIPIIIIKIINLSCFIRQFCKSSFNRIFYRTITNKLTTINLTLSLSFLHSLNFQSILHAFPFLLISFFLGVSYFLILVFYHRFIVNLLELLALLIDAYSLVKTYIF